MRNPNDVYVPARRDALAQLERIKSYLQSTPQTLPNWSGVADMQDLERQLHLINDRLYGEGEYAE